MALSFLSGSGSASNAKYFDIRLNDQYIVFRGSEHEAASAHLQGTVVLCLSEPLSMKHIRLQLTGMSRVCCYMPSASPHGGRRQWRERVFFERNWDFKTAPKGKTETLPAGNYEWPFDLVLEGSLPESIEGLSETWITYRFKAEIARKYAKDIIVRKPLRIIRTLDASALELSHAMSVENVWPNKIEYSISTPTKAVMFGSSMRVDFKLIPLLKGLRIGLIVSQLVESHDLTLNPEDTASTHCNFKNTRTILNDEYELDPDANLEIIDEEAEGYQFSRHLDLPKSLSRCLQDADAKGIKIRHKLKFRLQLHNPDGHISELRATLPVSIFISPNLAIDDNNNLVGHAPPAAHVAVEDESLQAPPLYGEHQFDQLYSDVDFSGYRTPGAGSGPGTPFGPLSRNISSENLASMNALTSSNISASALHSRLTSLHNSSATAVYTSPTEMIQDTPPESETASRRVGFPPPDYFGNPAHSSACHTPVSPELSRRSSDEVDHDQIASGMATPFYPQYAEAETLSRVPSYSTAVRSSVRPRDTNLPDYHAVVACDVASSPPVQSPQQAYLRRDNRQSLSQLASIDVLPRPDAWSSRISAGHVADEDERRLRLVQARARG